MVTHLVLKRQTGKDTRLEKGAYVKLLNEWKKQLEHN